jgi:NADPH-dependent 2,4-dienoyl-CoA reductase/sulfur reductase-like enzyme
VAQRLVVVGGDAAGMSAAMHARRRRAPEDLEVVAFERGRHTSYSACGIPYLVAGLVHDPEQLVARRPEQFRALGVDARIRHEVVEVDLGRRAVRVRALDAGTEAWEPFDQLVVATGARPRRPPVPGADATGILGVQRLDDGIALLDALDAERGGQGARRAVVVGGGYVGLEMAEALVLRGVPTTLVDARPQPMGTLDLDMGALVADALRGEGVELVLGEPVQAFEVAAGAVTGVVVGDRTLPADLVVLGLGVDPEVELGRAAGLAVGDAHGLRVDPRMRTSADGVWAAGDCVEVLHRVTGRHVAIALGTHANKQGRVAGIDCTGGDATFPGVVGTAVSKICAYEVARTGLTEAEAAAAGLDAEAHRVEATTRAGYFPGAGPITVKLVVERSTTRILGGQIIGREGAAKRIDVLAAAVWHEMAAEDLVGLDLSYAPPFSPVWDPVQVAARKASRVGR